MNTHEKLVRGLLANLAHHLRRLHETGHFSSQWLTDGSFNQGGWLHARVWAALAQATPDGYVANLELRLATPGRSETSFKPDLVVSDGEDTMALAVELESTNSSDGRVVSRDIDRLQYVALADKSSRPDSVLIITMLPSRPVVRWPMYEGLSPADAAGRARRRANPYAFHRDDYLAALASASKRATGLSIAWANVDVDAIRLEFWNGRYSKRPAWAICPPGS